MNSEIIIYSTEDGQTKIQTRLENETVWLTQEQMAELFQKAKSTINEHILNIYKEGELEKDTQIVIYQDKDSGISVDVKLNGDTIWLDQYQLETLFDTDRTSIGRHLRNIYNSNELDKKVTCAKIAQVKVL